MFIYKLTYSCGYQYNVLASNPTEAEELVIAYSKKQYEEIGKYLGKYEIPIIKNIEKITGPKIIYSKGYIQDEGTRIEENF